MSDPALSRTHSDGPNIWLSIRLPACDSLCGVFVIAYENKNGPNASCMSSISGHISGADCLPDRSSNPLFIDGREKPLIY